MTNLKPLAVLLATVAAAPALAADTVAKVDVTADLSAIQNAEAATFWGDLEADLEAAIGARVIDRLAEEGAEIRIDIRELELANAFERQLNLGDAVLVGMVHVLQNDTHMKTYELSVTLGTAQIVLAEGETLVLSTDTTSAYQRLVDVFADGVVARLD